MGITGFNVPDTEMLFANFDKTQQMKYENHSTGTTHEKIHDFITQDPQKFTPM